MKLKNLIKFCFFALSISMFFGSCQWVTVEPVEVVVPETVSFAADIEPIFSSAGCTGCHDGPTGKAGLDLRTGFAYNSINSKGFVNTGSPETSVIYVTPSPSGSHTVKYSAEESALILKWIQDGALNN